MPVFLVDVNRTQVLSEALATPDDEMLATRYATVYSGCEYGCAFCTGWANMVRPLNESVRMMPHLGAALDQELAELPAHELVALMGDSDPYQPGETKYRRTQAVLKAFARHKRPLSLMTRSLLATEDIPLLRYIHQQSFAMVVVSVLSHAMDVTSLLEPKLASTVERLAMVRQFREAGIPVGVSLSPLIPYVNDTDYALRQLFERISQSQAQFVTWNYLQLPHLRLQERVSDTLLHINARASAYMRDAFKGMSVIQDASYLSERQRAILDLCDEYRLPIRPPYELYRGRLSIHHEISMVLLHHAARDEYAGRHLIAMQGRRLAWQVRDGHIDEHALNIHPAYPMFRERLAK